jgi:hypothetical protein
MYRRAATHWPPGVGTQMAMWLRAVADAVEAGDVVNTAVRAFHAIYDLDDFLHALAPLVRDGMKKREADKRKGRRGRE